MRTNKFIPFIIALALHIATLVYFSHSSPTRKPPHSTKPGLQSIDLSTFKLTPSTSKPAFKQFQQNEKIKKDYSIKALTPIQIDQSLGDTSVTAEVSFKNGSSKGETNFVHNPAPPYPHLAREKEIEGKVRIKAFYNDNGNVIKIEILQSSGSDILDRSVQKTVKEWRLDKGASGSFEKSFEFKLNN